MTLPSRLVARSALAISSTTLLLGALGGTATSQPTPAGANIELPGVTVEAPKHLAKERKPVRQAASSSRHAATSPVAATTSIAPSSDTAKLAKLRHHEQLRRWLPVELQVGRQSLGRLQRVEWRVLGNVPQRRQLQEL